MKIAFIGQKGIPATFGGVEYHVDRLSRSLAAQGHEVFVYVRPWYSGKKQKDYQGVKLTAIPTLKTKHLDASVHSFLCSCHAVFQKMDIIHYHAIGPTAFSLLSRLAGKKVVSTIHRLDWATEKWGRFAKALLKLAEFLSVKIPHRTIVVSEELQQYIRKKYGKDTLWIPNGAELPETKPLRLVKDKYLLSPKGYLLFLGRLVPEKRVDWLIKAFQNLLRTSSKAANLKLVIAGGSSGTDEYVRKLRSMSRDYPNIIFTGFVWGEEKKELLSHALAFVLPSYLEGLPIALLEAKSYGLCCLASDIPAHREAIRHGQDGLLFRHSSLSDLGDKLGSLIDNPQRAEEMGKKAREEVGNRPTWQDVTLKVLEVYGQVLKDQDSIEGS
jgi:glycosyltransferase involved in cell wall biosynthesis